MLLRASPSTPAERQAAGSFAHGFSRQTWGVPWAWFATLTYSAAVLPWRCDHDVSRWLDAVAGEAGGHVLAVVGREAQGRGALHAHAVVAFFPGVAPLPGRLAERLWRPQGLARVVTFDETRGGAFYTVKDGAWGVRVGCPRPPGCRRPGRGCRLAALAVPTPLP